MSEQLESEPTEPTVWNRIKRRPWIVVAALLSIGLLSWSLVDRLTDDDTTPTNPQSNGQREPGAEEAERVAVEYQTLRRAEDERACSLAAGQELDSCNRAMQRESEVIALRVQPELVESVSVTRQGTEYEGGERTATAVVVRHQPESFSPDEYQYEFVYVNAGNKIVWTDSPDSASETPQTLWVEAGEDQ